MRFIEVKGRRPGAYTVTVTRNEIMCCINTPEQFVLAMVVIDKGKAAAPRYLWAPFHNEPELHVTSINFDWDALIAKSGDPI